MAVVAGLLAVLVLVVVVVAVALRTSAPRPAEHRYEPGERRQEFYLGRARAGYLADTLTVDELERSVAHVLAGGHLDPDGRVETGPGIVDAYMWQRALADEMGRGLRDAGRPLVLSGGNDRP